MAKIAKNTTESNSHMTTVATTGCFSIFRPPITNIRPYDNISLKDVYSMISSDAFSTETLHLRGLTEKNEARTFKSERFNYATFAGTFSKRSDNSLIERSGLICIDIDHISDIQDIKYKIIDLLQPALMFVSPSGDGLKVIYQVNINDGDHADYFDAICRFFKRELGISIDSAGKDVSRACFLPYDPDAIYNDGSGTLLDIAFINTYPDEQITVPYVTPTNEVIRRLITWLDKQEQFTEGNRNRYITKLAHALNRYGINEQDALSELLKYTEPGFNESGIRATVKSVYRHVNYHGISSFDTKDEETFDVPISVQNATETLIVPPMPIEGWPDLIQGVISECSKVYDSHRDFWNISFLAAASLAIGQTYILKGKYENAPLFWIAEIGSSGTGKTKPIEFALEPFQLKDNESFKQYDEELTEYEDWKQIPRKERAGEIREMPVLRQYILTDTSPEALAITNKNNERGIAICREELEGWLNDFGRYGKSGEVQNMLSSWMQQPFTVNRTSSKPFKIAKPFISVVGGIQPERLIKLAEDGRNVNGFIPRICFAFPDKCDSPYYSTKTLAKEYKEQYRYFIEKLISIKGTRNEVRLSFEAEKLYEQFFNKNADENNTGIPDSIREINAKLNIIVLRVALTLHVCNNEMSGITNPEISDTTIQHAINITEYFRLTQRKVNQILNADINLDNKQIIKVLRSKGASQQNIANVLGITQQAVQKTLKNISR